MVTYTFTVTSIAEDLRPEFCAQSRYWSWAFVGSESAFHNLSRASADQSDF
jgi:hypothetical protein